MLIREQGSCMLANTCLLIQAQRACRLAGVSVALAFSLLRDIQSESGRSRPPAGRQDLPERVVIRRYCLSLFRAMIVVTILQE
jgi:hypothetical protein